MKLEWERIDEYRQRATVPGGWLVRVLEDIQEERHSRRTIAAMSFVPDEGHYWVVDK